jgi:hypothetical protein
MLQTPNLVGFWPFEGNANDVSGNALNGTVNGAVLTAGKIGQCYDFTPEQSITLPIGTAPNTANRLTVAMWFYNRATLFPDTYRMMWGVPGKGTYIALRTASLTPFFSINTSGGQKTMQGGINVTRTTWHHIAATWDGASMAIYVNGASAGSQAYGGVTLSIPSSPSANIGDWDAVGYAWDGLIDEVCVYSTALPASDIKRLMMGLHPLNG